VKTDIFMYVKSITDAIIDYASNKNIDIIVIGTKGRTITKVSVRKYCK
jgi:hypothetical protein